MTKSQEKNKKSEEQRSDLLQDNIFAENDNDDNEDSQNNENDLKSADKSGDKFNDKADSDFLSDNSSDDSSSHYKAHTPSHIAVLSSLQGAALSQYESFRRSGFGKANIKRIISSVLGQACNPNFVIAVAGIAKVFVGELVVLAKEIQEEERKRLKKSGAQKTEEINIDSKIFDTNKVEDELDEALLPSHIHEAYRRLADDMPHLKKRRYLD